MKVVMVMFDSLNRHYLPSYGNDEVIAPNFKKLAEKSVQFNQSYVCSMPCMPARRDFQTGRPNFLHRSWGPMEPFDFSMPEYISKNGISSHIITDHYHYWEDGGSTYLGRYDTYEMIRGQENDAWKGDIGDIGIPDNKNGKGDKSGWVNRKFQPNDASHSQTLTFDASVEFLQRNKDCDNWFLQIEAFDPHEPFFVHDEWKELYPSPKEDALLYDWPAYAPCNDSEEDIEQVKNHYKALLTKCDDSLGRILQVMDDQDMWEDTMLIVWTDHGYLLGEHGWWAKNAPPLYEEICHTPFFIWNPQVGEAGTERNALVQPSIDLAPTMLDFFGMDIPESIKGKNLKPVLTDDSAVREYAAFGYHGKELNVTDGKHIYRRSSVTKSEGPLYEYTLMPTRMRGFINEPMLKEAELTHNCSISNGIPVLKIPSTGTIYGKTPSSLQASHTLVDIQSNPETKVTDPTIEERFTRAAKSLLDYYESPKEQYERLGLGN